LSGFVSGLNYTVRRKMMKKIVEGVSFIQGQDDFVPDSHVYVIGQPESKDLSLVDAGLIGKGKYKIGEILGGAISLDDIKRIILTHTHLDHIGCLREIMDAIPHADLWVHSAEAELLERGDDKTVYGMEMFRSMCQSQYGIEPGAFTFKVSKKIEGGETLEIGDMVWDVLHVPGHSAGGIALYSPVEKVLIPGDVVYADYAIGRFDLHGANGVQLKDSLYRLAELEVNILLPGHNRIDVDVREEYIKETARQWERYLT
jgi:glyoxylase-like metal-dependent hydrolase (beta-lactamase superfamily II)